VDRPEATLAGALRLADILPLGASEVSHLRRSGADRPESPAVS